MAFSSTEQNASCVERATAWPSRYGRVFRPGHMTEPARLWLKRRSPSYLMRRGADERRECFLHPFTSFHTADSHQRVFHGRSAHVQLRIGRSGGRGRGRGAIPMETATEGAGVITRRAEAHLPCRTGRNGCPLPGLGRNRTDRGSGLQISLWRH
ncbi:hypothetical protein SUGI_0506370 [Cryptomeria japonica]|nr:hypothetical protein SUGI_0506370 [Cryptomeria japonica]